MRYEKPIHYDQKSAVEFQQSLKKKMDEYFESIGGNRKANLYMWTKVALFVSSYWFFWSELALQSHSLTTTLLLFAGLTASSLIVAFNVSHDAAHGALSGHPRLDHFIFYFTFNFLGPNAYLWRIRHSNAHHFFVNIPGS